MTDENLKSLLSEDIEKWRVCAIRTTYGIAKMLVVSSEGGYPDSPNPDNMEMFLFVRHGEDYMKKWIFPNIILSHSPRMINKHVKE